MRWLVWLRSGLNWGGAELSSWNDGSGREWVCKVTVSVAEQLRGEGIDLLNPKVVSQLYSKDPIELVQFAAKLHKSQIEEYGLTVGDFVDLATDSEDVSNAMLGAVEAALCDFFRRMRRGALAAVVQRASESAAALDVQQTELVVSERAGEARYGRKWRSR